jgi:hypothetical protein
MGVLAAMLEKGVERTIRKVALVVDQAVVMATPVDTGRARSNWIVSIGGPSTEVKPPYVPGEGGASGAANAAKAIEQAAGEVAKFKLADHSIHLTNNLPYITRLNEGYSAQAPAGFVQKGIRAAVNAVKNTRLLVEGSTRGD